MQAVFRWPVLLAITVNQKYINVHNAFDLSDSHGASLIFLKPALIFSMYFSLRVFFMSKNCLCVVFSSLSTLTPCGYGVNSLVGQSLCFKFADKTNVVTYHIVGLSIIGLLWVHWLYICLFFQRYGCEDTFLCLKIAKKQIDFLMEKKTITYWYTKNSNAKV